MQTDYRDILLAVAAAALILCAVVIATMEPPAAETPAVTRPAEPDGTDAPADSSSELWSDDSTLHRIKPLEIPLEAETQWAIFEACEYDPGLFCFLMAIGQQESRFNPDTQGDGGASLGVFQINIRWHTGRMEALGVTDLTDTAQCAAVALDYLRELVSRYGFEPESEALLMAYNMGPGGARKAINAGQTSTDYSREVMTVYRGYLEELEG
ncbi:MAG: transglycosylase SLT domain-containing protein [Oscillospiraceae bacterium]|nr:transglycosylase SLT domain-containing protein [Oscillospiraceae bacterium]